MIDFSKRPSRALAMPMRRATLSPFRTLVVVSMFRPFAFLYNPARTKRRDAINRSGMVPEVLF